MVASLQASFNKSTSISGVDANAYEIANYYIRCGQYPVPSVISNIRHEIEVLQDKYYLNGTTKMVDKLAENSITLAPGFFNDVFCIFSHLHILD